jgi:predicted hotdog family 3-hydroxylacyl-ACP dehydratase
MIDQARIRELIPHAGSMCLIDSVATWDEAQIECRASTHVDRDHPLRHQGRLGAVHLVEYAAQAAAIHGALLSARDTALEPGMLVALRDCEFLQDTVDQLPGPLTVNARRQLANSDGLIYQFEVSSGSQTVLARGRLSVMLAR